MPDCLTGMWGMMGPGMILGWLLLIGIVAAVVLAIVWAVRRIGQPPQAAETPLSIFQRRYARDEIT